MSMVGKVSVIATGLATYLLYGLLFGDNGFGAYQSLANEVFLVKQQSERMETATKQIAQDVADSKKPAVIEERARMKYSMVKPNEKIIAY